MTKTFASVLFVAAATVLAAAQSPSAADLYQDALRFQEAKGDLVKAIEMYRTLVDRFGADQTVAPKALLEMARCYELLGQPEAGAVYERIATKYAASPAAVIARAKLADGQKTPGLVVKQVWSETGDSVSPDGKYMTTTNWDTGDLAVYEFSSGKTRDVTKYGKWDGSFAQGGLPSPDGKQLAYSRYDRPSDNESLRVVPRDGGADRILFRPEGAYVSLWPVAWSTDGKVVYAMVDQVTSPVTVRPRQSLRKLTAFPLDGRPSRVLRQFETQGVSQMNPSLSPDGKSFAYSSVTTPGKPERDIRLLSIDSGQETTLIEHPADDEMAAWFPAGDRILFTSDRGGSRGLWSVPVSDGKATSEPEPVRPDIGPLVARGFTKNGDFYYSVTTGEAEVYLGSLSAGDQPQKLERLPSRFVGLKRQAAWSPDSSKLAYVRPDPAAERPALNRELVVHNAATGVARVLPLTMQQFQNPAWMPDGRTVVVNGRDLDGAQGLFLVNTDSGLVTPIVTRAAVPDLQRASPAVSADGKRIYFTWAAPGQTGVGGLASRDVATGEETKITTTPVSAFDLSPDGKWFVTADALAGGANGPLSIVPATGGAARRIGAGDPGDWISRFAWMPDSKSVVAIHRGDNGLEFWLLPIDGSQPRNTGLVWKAGINRISVSRDGRLALSTDRQRAETWVIQNFPHVKK